MESDNNININYNEALEFLYAQLPMFSRVGAAAYKPGLERVIRLSEFLGHPEKKFKSIHVGGTNGKGSTSHMIAAALQAAGYKTALYTSPHLVDFRERIKINGDLIPRENVINFINKWRNSDYSGDAPSFFELTMMMAFDWFAAENVDYAVIEVGMGGRLDSTNIISPEISVITNISLDHTQFLGNTLPLIAAEKAGIIKKNIPVIIGEADGEIETAFHNKALEVGAPIFDAYKSNIVSEFKLKEDYSGWCCHSDVIGDFEVDLAGDYQQKNITTALTAILKLREKGIDLSNEQIKKGLASAAKSTGLMGRWTILSQQPLTICDTGHNIGGLSWNVERLKNLQKEKGGTIRMLIGFVADKAIDEILSIFPTDAEYYITNAQIPRALPAKDLLAKVEEHNLHGATFDCVMDAYEHLLQDAQVNDILYIGGSTFIVADLLSNLQK